MVKMRSTLLATMPENELARTQQAQSGDLMEESDASSSDASSSSVDTGTSDSEGSGSETDQSSNSESDDVADEDLLKVGDGDNGNDNADGNTYLQRFQRQHGPFKSTARMRCLTSTRNTVHQDIIATDQVNRGLGRLLLGWQRHAQVQRRRTSLLPSSTHDLFPILQS